MTCVRWGSFESLSPLGPEVIVLGGGEYAPGRQVCPILAFMSCGSSGESGLCLLVPRGDDRTFLCFL